MSGVKRKMISGRAILFLVILAVIIGFGTRFLYYLLLPKLKNWSRKADKKYKDYEKKEARK